jgi:hypothetical protein
MFKKCSTPGCTFHDFHDGAHSIEIIERKQKRKICALNIDTPTITVDACGIEGYGGMCKVGQREMFVYASKETDARVMYLDGADAALTTLLLKRGVPTDRLVPVNNRTNVAQQIERICPGVKCKVDNICNIAKNTDACEFGVVWFDMCGVDFGMFEVSDLVHCAATKFFTLSSRQLLCVDQQAALCRDLVANQEKIIEQTLYTGLSGKSMNMLFVVSKGTGNSDHSTHYQHVNVGTVVKIPLSYWRDHSFLGVYNYKVFGNAGNESLIGAVHSRVTNSNSEYRLTFQCNNGTTMLCSSKYRHSVILSYTI